MAPRNNVKAGDACPQCGGAFVLDAAQAPAGLIDRHARNSHMPAQAARFATAVREKADEVGLIHRCTSCDYRARFQVSSKAA